MSHKLEVLVPAKETVRCLKDSFSRCNALLLSIAESCSMHKDWKGNKSLLLNISGGNTKLEDDLNY